MIRPAKKFSLLVTVVVLGTAFTVVLFGFPGYSGELGTLVLALTLGVLVWYAHDTNRIANETVSQTELQTTPIMALYIRNVTGIDDIAKQQKVSQYALTRQSENAIDPTNFYIALRNMGNGPAFNTTIESENFCAEKYQTRFFAPHNDEHAVKIIRKPANKIRNLTELSGEIFLIKCQSVLGKAYEFRYRIVDVEQKIVEFLS